MKKIIVILVALTSVSVYAAFGLSEGFDTILNLVEGKLYSLQNFINSEYKGEIIQDWEKMGLRDRKVTFTSISYDRPQVDFDVIDAFDVAAFMADMKNPPVEDANDYRRLTFNVDVNVPDIRVYTKYYVRGHYTHNIHIKRTIKVKSSGAKLNVKYMLKNTSNGVRLLTPLVSVDVSKLHFDASGSVGDDIVEYVLDKFEGKIRGEIEDLLKKEVKDLLNGKINELIDEYVGIDIMDYLDDRHVYTLPKIDGKRLDYCKSYGKDCGQPAANAFCWKNGSWGALLYVKENNVGPTKLINGQTCNSEGCDSFSHILCY